MTFEYIRREEDGSVAEIVEAVQALSLEIRQGEFVGILGHNGSGKSTLAKLLNALLEPTEGVVLIDGMNTCEKEKVPEIRRHTGMIFQNPDNQIIGTMIEEDVAFGPENLGVPTDEIADRVAEALEAVGMAAYRQQSPQRLSGGQKQRVAIAGVLAMKPRCIIFDESTAMLDPQGRREVLQAAHTLNRERAMTVLFITHDMDEVADADRIVVLHQGRMVLDGTPETVFASEEQLQEYGLTLPKTAQLAAELRRRGISFPTPVLKPEDFAAAVRQLCVPEETRREQDGRTQSVSRARRADDGAQKEESRRHAMTDGLALDRVSYTYGAGTVYARQALKEVSLTIDSGEFVAIIGHTGSGKSTLIQQFDGLLRPSEGHVYYRGQDIYEKGYRRSELRGRVGLVFQYPESQLFAETVLEDVSFGPKNLGLPLLEVQQRAFQAIEAVGLPDTVYDLSPFELSGGQKRRVAIAGVLAMKPEILVLDEPAAGLDPAGRLELLNMLRALHAEGMTVVLVSHSMEDAAEYADRLIVMDQGTIVMDGSTEAVFRQEKQLYDMGLEIPAVTRILKLLAADGHRLRTDVYRMADCVDVLMEYLTV